VTIATTVRQALDASDLGYEVVPHPRTHTSAASAAAAHVPDDHLAKAVLLQDAEGQVLAVVPGDRWVDLDQVQRELGREMAVAPEEAVDARFADCSPGAVPPLGRAYGLTTLLDEDLASLANVYFEAGDHESLIHVSGETFTHLLAGARRGHFGRTI
jgi:Ala-tRNA(Pro) deacylase